MDLSNLTGKLDSSLKEEASIKPDPDVETYMEDAYEGLLKLHIDC